MSVHRGSSWISSAKLVFNVGSLSPNQSGYGHF